jgi:D-3-phosphoglycerate dehydrogenase
MTKAYHSFSRYEEPSYAALKTRAFSIGNFIPYYLEIDIYGGATMTKIVLTEFSWGSHDVEIQYLPKDSYVVATDAMSEDSLIETCRDADAILSEYAPFSRRVLKELKNCKIISNAAVGVDNIDTTAAGDLGIAVANVPGYCAYEVADHTFALILASLRNIAAYDRDVRKGNWDINNTPVMHRIAGRKLGLLGFGNIPQMVSKRASGFDLETIAYDPYVTQETASRLNVRLVTMDELLETADIISCHLPLLPSTVNVINAGAFAKMKKKPFFINTSRGKVVNQEDLSQALKNGLLSGAALDVLAVEPPSFSDEIFSFDNVIITPHVGFFSVEALLEVRRRSAENVVNFLNGAYEKVSFVVRPK